jgi:hypothetical protein
MTDTRLSDSTVSFLRRMALIAGITAIVVALLADKIGLNAGNGLSGNQIVLGAGGIALIIASGLGRRFFDLYRGFAVFLLNLLITIVIVDFLALALVKFIDSERINRRADHTNNRTGVSSEWRVTISNYVPWVIWRSNPSYEGDPVTIDPMGRRITTGGSSDPLAFKVFALGGSAMWGTGMTDSCTIASLLNGELSERSGRPAAVINLAQNAHVSTQEVIELMLELRAGNIPDFVVFYDGFNDVFAAYESSIAGVHQSYLAIAARIEGTGADFDYASPLQVLLHSSNMWLFVTVLRERLDHYSPPEPENLVSYRSMGLDTDSLAREVVKIYFQNCSLIEHLANTYGFQCLFVWQPVLWCGDKDLTDFEITIRDGGFDNYPAGGDPALQELLVASYAVFNESRPDSLRYISLQNFFNNTTGQVYIDFTGVHISANANALIAAELAGRILSLNPDSSGPGNL